VSMLDRLENLTWIGWHH